MLHRDGSAFCQGQAGREVSGAQTKRRQRVHQGYSLVEAFVTRYREGGKINSITDGEVILESIGCGYKNDVKGKLDGEIHRI